MSSQAPDAVIARAELDELLDALRPRGFTVIGPPGAIGVDRL